MPTVPDVALRAATINTSQPGAWRVRPRQANTPGWSSPGYRALECALYPVAAQPGVIVLPGLRNAGEPALVASCGRARARCTAKARRWRGAERVGEAGDAASLGWHESALARTHRRRARAGGSGRSALSPGRTSPSPFAPTTSATGLTLHYILTAKNFRIVKIVRIYEETTMRAPTTVRKCYYGISDIPVPTTGLDLRCYH